MNTTTLTGHENRQQNSKMILAMLLIGMDQGQVTSLMDWTTMMNKPSTRLHGVLRGRLTGMSANNMILYKQMCEWIGDPGNLRYTGPLLGAADHVFHKMVLLAAGQGAQIDQAIQTLYDDIVTDKKTRASLAAVNDGCLTEPEQKYVLNALVGKLIEKPEILASYGHIGTMAERFNAMAESIETRHQTPVSLSQRLKSALRRIIGYRPGMLRPVG